MKKKLLLLNALLCAITMNSVVRALSPIEIMYVAQIIRDYPIDEAMKLCNISEEEKAAALDAFNATQKKPLDDLCNQRVKPVWSKVEAGTSPNEIFLHELETFDRESRQEIDQFAIRFFAFHNECLANKSNSIESCDRKLTALFLYHCDNIRGHVGEEVTKVMDAIAVEQSTQ